MSHEGYHESADLLPEATKDFHRAIESLIEELEAVDWYQQRADATKEETLRAVLLHNRNEEVEHAMMTLEWLRRRDAKIDETARMFLFAEGEITEIEAAKKAAMAAGAAAGSGGGSSATPAASSSPSLGIGSLRNR
ncbi:MAG TPA: encapsulin-associated ferritin-like protein [Polyangia bacterium]|jgi:ferritin-like protein|nr:encapsulin-associated ferritin-like protein [Polyangia bacterium]